MPTYTWKNRETEEIREFRSKISERNNFLDTVDDPENWARTPELLVNSTRNSENYIGHTPQSRKDQVRLYSEQLKLTSKMYSTDPDKQGEVKKEIRKVKKALDKT